jgi:hypothetical protein
LPLLWVASEGVYMAERLISRGSVASACLGVSFGLLAIFFGVGIGSRSNAVSDVRNEIVGRTTVLGGSLATEAQSGVNGSLFFDSPEDRWTGDSHSAALATLANAKLAAGDTVGALATLKSIPRTNSREAARASVLTEIMTTLTRDAAEYDSGNERIDVETRRRRVQDFVDQYVAIADTLETDALKCRYFARLSRLARDLRGNGFLANDSAPTPDAALKRADAVSEKVSAAANLVAMPRSNGWQSLGLLGIPTLFATIGLLVFEASKSLCNEFAKSLGGIVIGSVRDKRKQETNLATPGATG